MVELLGQQVRVLCAGAQPPEAADFAALETLPRDRQLHEKPFLPWDVRRACRLHHGLGII